MGLCFTSLTLAAVLFCCCGARSLRCSRYLLPLPQIRSSLHILPLQYHPHAACVSSTALSCRLSSALLLHSVLRVLLVCVVGGAVIS